MKFGGRWAQALQMSELKARQSQSPEEVLGWPLSFWDPETSEPFIPQSWGYSSTWQARAPSLRPHTVQWWTCSKKTIVTGEQNASGLSLKPSPFQTLTPSPAWDLPSRGHWGVPSPVPLQFSVPNPPASFPGMWHMWSPLYKVPWISAFVDEQRYMRGCHPRGSGWRVERARLGRGSNRTVRWSWGLFPCPGCRSHVSRSFLQPCRGQACPPEPSRTQFFAQW